MKRIKKLRTTVAMCICLAAVSVICFGCGSKKSGIEVSKEQTGEDVQTTESITKTTMVPDEKVTKEVAQSSGGAGNGENTGEDAALPTEIVVYVCGAVNNPGIYTLSGTSRMADAVQAAGGMNEQADKNVLNLAQYISDGQMIRIPAIGEVTDATDDSSGNSTDNSNDKVDLNSADVTELMTIPGVGQSKAEAIIQYREEHGRFETIEDIMQVSGIKEGSFAKMEPYICVK